LPELVLQFFFALLTGSETEIKKGLKFTL